MARTDRGIAGIRARRDESSGREERVARAFELVLVLAGGATGIWLIVSVLTSAHR